MTKTSKAFVAAAVAAASLTLSAQADSSSAAPLAREVVLVHGALADGSGWHRLYDQLTERGYRVTIVQNLLTSLANDVAAA